MRYPQYKGVPTTELVQQPDKASAARRLSLFVRNMSYITSHLLFILIKNLTAFTFLVIQTTV